MYTEASPMSEVKGLLTDEETCEARDHGREARCHVGQERFRAWDR